MKKLSIVLALVLCISVLFSGCALIMNLTDPLPEEYIEGIKLPKDYPDDDLEIYDDAIVFEEEEDDDEITIKYGTEDELDDIIDFFEDLFDEDNLTLDESEEKDDEYTATGMGDGFKFEITAEEASGKYEERAFQTVVEVKIQFYEMGQGTLEKMQGFWLQCGIDGDIDDIYRMDAMGWEFDSMNFTSYTWAELDFSNNDITFINDNTFTFEFEGDIYEIEVRFEDGYMIVKIDGEASEYYFEKSSYDDMIMYNDMYYNGDGDSDWDGGNIYLSDYLSDDDLEYYIGYYDWYLTYYYETDGTYTSGDFFNRMYFDPYDYSGEDEYSEEIYDITWEVSDGILYIYYTDGSTDAYMLDFEYDGSYWYLYLFDVDLGYSDYAYVFTTTYYDPGTGDSTTSNDGTVGLFDYISDEDLELYVSYIDWYMVLYFETDGTYTDGDFYNRLYLDAYDYTGEDEYDDALYTFSWYIYDGILYMNYDDGSSSSYMIDYEYDGTDQWLYLFDPDLGYDDYAYVLRAWY